MRVRPVILAVAGALAGVLALSACATGTAPDARITPKTQVNNPALATLPDVPVIPDLTYTTDAGIPQKLDVCTPPDSVTADGTGPYPAIVEVHGGSWARGDKADLGYRAICQWLASAGYVTFDVDYRLAPQHPFPAGFDDAVRSGQKPPLELYLSGQSYASNRIILSVTTLDLVRAVEGRTPPVDVELVQSGTTGLPISLRLVPILVMYALFVAGTFLPASSIVDEKVHGTLTAMLVTPARLSEILTAKAALGAVMAFLMSVVTLLLNGALGSNWLDVVAVVLLGAVFASLIGVVIGSLAKDASMLFTIMKSSGILLFGPVIFYVFPQWPQWIAKLFPTYWMIDPIWRVAVLGEGVGDVWRSIAVAVGIACLLVLVVARLSLRLRAQMAAAA